MNTEKIENTESTEEPKFSEALVGIQKEHGLDEQPASVALLYALESATLEQVVSELKDLKAELPEGSELKDVAAGRMLLYLGNLCEANCLVARKTLSSLVPELDENKEVDEDEVTEDGA